MRVRVGWLTIALIFAVLHCPSRAAGADRPLLKKANPVYPELARQMRVFGLIRLKISVLPSGEVGEMVLESGHPLLVNAAKDAVRQWRFAAAPEATSVSVVVRFDLP